MEKDKKKEDYIEQSKKNKFPALLYISLGIIIYFSGKQANPDFISVQTGIGILLLAIGAIKVVLYFINKNKKQPEVSKISTEPTKNSKGKKNNKKKNRNNV